ncbi:hypothetical protein [Mesobacillus subterraneus]|nr:hypothetical protein [Mesobacillus subterraneus]
MIEETIEMMIVIAATENADAVSKYQIKIGESRKAVVFRDSF